MTRHWTAATLLCTALIAGCSSAQQENTQNYDENEAAPTGATAGAGAEDPSVLSPGADAPDATAPTSPPVTTTPSGQAVSRPAPAPRPAAPAPGRAESSALDRTETARTEPAPAPRPVVREVTIPSGTPLRLELTNALSSETAAVETPVTARLRQPVVVGGLTALPAGAIVHGEVTDVARPGRVEGRARLAIRFTSVSVGNERENLRSDLVIWEGERTRGEDATKIGVGAGIGAALGGILGGGDGAAKGAAIGGAAGTGAVLATRGKDVVVAAGTDITTNTIGEVDVRVR